MKSAAIFITLLALLSPVSPSRAEEPIPGAKKLTWDDDIASRLVDGVDRFLLRELDNSIKRRTQYWKRDFSSTASYNQSIEPNRKRLAHILGVRDKRKAFKSLELIGSTSQPALIAEGKGYKVYSVRWPVIGDMTAEGLLLEPNSKQPVANIVAIADADHTPEMITGLSDGVAAESQFARRLAESGCRVIVPSLINREMKPRNGRANLTSREFLYRSAFEMGRHLIGYEVQKVLAGVDWLANEAGGKEAAIGVIGHGEGGMIALYSGALDTRIDAVCVSGYFNSRQNIWNEPIDRNVFGLLEQFGDAELASMIAPRSLTVEAARGPELELPSNGGAPAVLKTPGLAIVQKEVARANRLIKDLAAAPQVTLIISQEGQGPFGTPKALSSFLTATSQDAVLASLGTAPKADAKRFNSAARQQRQIHEIDRHSQAILKESPYVRTKFMSKLDVSSVEKYEQSVEPYRAFYRDEVIGHFDQKRMPFNIRARKTYDEEKWTGYEVVMDVFPDVIAYGILCLPKDLKPGDKRPVVVCQHGLEGRPQDIVTGDHRAYHDFASKLAERGFVTFAPQNLYIFKDRFRTLQRKANPLKKTLFSVIVPQHQQITDWLGTLPYVDKERIGFYGLSYGGKSAMRIPPLVDNYCLSICSADFNEWVDKNASTRAPYSYVWTGEYEIFEFDLGSTFNYSEMAALICPRPFMVERGHFDGVGEDAQVGAEFARVRTLYQAKLGIGDRCEIEWFVGPHTINGKGTYDFLHKHLNWPKK